MPPSRPSAFPGKIRAGKYRGVWTGGTPGSFWNHFEKLSGRWLINHTIFHRIFQHLSVLIFFCSDSSAFRLNIPVLHRLKTERLAGSHSTFPVWFLSASVLFHPYHASIFPITDEICILKIKWVVCERTVEKRISGNQSVILQTYSWKRGVHKSGRKSSNLYGLREEIGF